MKTNQRGIDLIKHFESLELCAYPDPASDLGKACSALKLPMREYRKVMGWEALSGVPWTIGFGHTGHEVKEGMKISQGQAEELLRRDLERFEAGVLRLVKVTLTENQFSALVCFAFNVGLDENHNGKAEGLGESTLLKMLNTGNYAKASEEFPKWNKASGQVLEGLITRRAAEKELFVLT